ncbi:MULTISPECIES: type I-E CRISPR-associated endonuclease Cas1e [Streptomyces]|uniref:CRISPR-associated endonuclease Cas1 n=2 Tax=Streptomyces TaxID=1883 RepID=A0A0W7X3Q1_9ACTN|nr:MULTISPECIES: type I-E CRISPR-associated endonuclease Cas1e [Streptomyces]KUF17314.1 type I-E CRISPR-associated endonuclease Cas1 [Streptomyces silvensis]MVO84570.1 type I-E CRISPR-associated endonuclease Cas1 [Streptomyces typhae]
MTSVAKRPHLTPRQLTRTSERVSFLYLERCIVHRDANAITAQDAQGTKHIPAATIGTLLLGPGTRVTHQAMTVLGETGAAVCWVGEHGVRYYASGRALSRSSALMEAQARQWANPRSRLAVARAMYRLRFPDEDPEGLTRQELLGREGRRVKDCYRAQAQRTGIAWRGRRYVPGDFSSGDAVNQAVTAAAQCMYGIAHAVVTSLGCSPALGFVHSGHELSFVLDIADLYKTEIGIPLAFDVAAESEEDVGPRTRRAVRDRINELSLLERCVDDIQRLLLPPEAALSASASDADRDVVTLQSDAGQQVASGVNYAGSNGAEDDYGNELW